MKQLAAILACTFCLCAVANDLAALKKREENYTRGLVVATARLLQQDEPLRKMHVQLTQQQQAVYLILEKHPEVKRIARLKKSAPARYEQEYARIRLRAIATNEKLRSHTKEIRRLRADIDRRLRENPAIARLQNLIVATQKQIRAASN